MVRQSLLKLDPTHANFSGTEPDVDGDGLDNAWEFSELLSYTFGPNDDPDNDSFTNLQEFTNGTDPYVDETTLNTEVFFNTAAIEIYPNPAKKYFKIDVRNDLDTSKISDMSIYNSIGCLV